MKTPHSIRLLFAVVGMVLALLGGNAQAATYYKWYPNNNPTASQPRFQTPQQACTYLVTSIWGLPGPGTATAQDASTYNCFDNGGGARGSTFRETVSLTCTPPLVAKFTGSGSTATWTCQTTACPVGEGRTFNRTEGWGRSPNADADDLVVDNGPPSFYDYNDGVCIGNIAKVDKCFRSQEPSAQGLYRTSCDYTMVNSGEAGPGTGENAAKPTDPIAACPGTLGTVNGKPLCVGTAASPLPAGTAPPNSPTAAGNPSAGVKPATGEGSGSTGAGRTPTSGAGGNTGGPAGAAVGRGGTGARGDPGEDGEDGTAVCGAPPLPACSVKVDETGTPNGSTFGTSPELDSALNSREAGLATARDAAGDASWGIIPAWTEDRPCEPWHIYTLPEFIGGTDVNLDLCPLMPIADGIANFLWVMLGIFAVTGMVSRAITGGGA